MTAAGWVKLPVLLGTDQDGYTANQMTYDLQRLRLHGLIGRLPGTHRYRITESGARAASYQIADYNLRRYDREYLIAPSNLRNL